MSKMPSSKVDDNCERCGHALEGHPHRGPCTHAFGCAMGCAKFQKKRRWRDLSWPDFCRWVAGRAVADERDLGDGRVEIEFYDESVARVQSHYDGPWSEYTPGAGLEAPTVEVTP